MNNKQTLAIGLSVIAAILYLAATFNIIPNNIGLFWGVLFSIGSGLVWVLWPKKPTENKE